MDPKEDIKKCENYNRHWHFRKSNGLFGGAYGLIFVGAAVYYIQHSNTFWMGVLGFLKAMVWPAMLAYKVFTMLHM